ncbi:MAG: sulfatase-like hydrolase/transferase [Acidobacteria bacterium]|nr:sulfatase-like hydrolase/transferase [Acidobacteriota bacterium]
MAGRKPTRRRGKESRAQPDSPRRVRTAIRLSLVALLMVLVVGAGLVMRSRTGDQPPDVILITVDTLRADALGYAGNSEVQTPFIDRLAGEGTVFENAYAHNVVTLPSHANMLTGLYPYQHGVRDNAGFRLDPGHETIAAMLLEKGYVSGAFVAAFPLDARYGLNQGFETYDDQYREGSFAHQFVMAQRSAEEVLRPAISWFEAKKGQPRFLWIHLYEPHAPYQPPSPFAEQYASNPYLGEVAAVDHYLQGYLGPILEQQKNLLLIFTSDHGEALGEHGELTHGLFAYEPTLKVPLLIRDGDRLRGRRDARLARHIDLVPTILDRVGLPLPDGLPGRSLLQPEGSEKSYFEALTASFNRGWAPLIGMISGSHKYIDLPLPELYDLENDPREENNLVAGERRVTAALRESLREAAPERAAERNVSADETAQLLSLGYITGTAAKKSYTAEDDPKNLIHLDRQMQEAIALYHEGALDEAIVLAERVLAERPDMEYARELHAFVLQQVEKPALAIDSLREALRINPGSDGVRRRLGLLLSENGHAAEAVEVLRNVSRDDDPELLNAYGIALADLGNVAEAVRQFERALERDATNATAYQNLGIVALRAQEHERARKYLLEALHLNDRLPLTLNALGVLYAQQGDARRAIEAWSKAVAVNPQQYDALFNLSVTAGRIGEWEIARESLTRFIRTAPPERYARDLDAARAMLREVERRRAGG